MMKKRVFSIVIMVALVFLLGITTTNKYKISALNEKEEKLSTPAVENKLYTPTVKNMLANATLPIGKAVYVYGGAWNEEDTAAGIEAMSYGISPQWEKFYNSQSASYDYSTTRYQIHNGLDCTGYVGWTMYQLFGNTYSDTGYVYASKKMAATYAGLFGGTYTDKSNVTKRQCGDIMSSNGHAYMVVGQCKDGSVVFLHASPPAVSLCGTYTPGGNKNSEAVKLATHYMKTYFPSHYKKYPSVSRNQKYLTDYNRMQWSEEVLPDPDGYRDMWADEILKDLFEEVKIYSSGKRVLSDAAPYIEDGTTYVPLRAVSESFGADVLWDEKTKTATVKSDYHTLKINLEQNNIIFDDTYDARTFQIENDRITVPIRMVAQLCELSVKWEGVSKSVYLENIKR